MEHAHTERFMSLLYEGIGEKPVLSSMIKKGLVTNV